MLYHKPAWWIIRDIMGLAGLIIKSISKSLKMWYGPFLISNFLLFRVQMKIFAACQFHERGSSSQKVKCTQEFWVYSLYYSHIIHQCIWTIWGITQFGKIDIDLKLLDNGYNLVSLTRVLLWALQYGPH